MNNFQGKSKYTLSEFLAKDPTAKSHQLCSSWGAKLGENLESYLDSLTECNSAAMG